MILFDNVTYDFPGGTRALDNVSVHIGPGEKITVIGNNGSGKTTFALLINGILKAAAGRVEVCDLDPLDDEQNRRLKQKVGLVFQNPDNQLVSSTVEREIAFSLENRNLPRTEMIEKVAGALSQFHLEDYRDRLTSELSGGEKQRLALAAVMVAEPDILILDEPGSFLDESGRRSLDVAVERLLAARPDLTVIRITQYTEVAAKADRLLVFGGGRLLADDHPDKVFGDEALCRRAGIAPPLHYRLMSGNADKAETAGVTRTEPGLGASSISLKLDFKYNGQETFILHEADLEIRGGRVYGLVGPTGCGKTTLAQLLARLLKPTRGEVRYRGFDPKPGAVAVSFQHPERQFFLDTVEKEIRFGAENLKRPDIDHMTVATYEHIGLDRMTFGNRDPFSLSGGEKRRLAFGTILPVKPMFIMFDEPTCGLDAHGTELFKQMVRRLKADGTGLVIISHQGDIILDLADEIITIKDQKPTRPQPTTEFFLNEKYAEYLSCPEIITYQLNRFGEVKYFTEAELVRSIV